MSTAFRVLSFVCALVAFIGVMVHDYKVWIPLVAIAAVAGYCSRNRYD